MPGSTPKYGFPYPLGTDPISDGDDQIKALALAVENFIGGVRSWASVRTDTPPYPAPGTWAEIVAITCTGCPSGGRMLVLSRIAAAAGATATNIFSRYTLTGALNDVTTEAHVSVSPNFDASLFHATFITATQANPRVAVESMTAQGPATLITGSSVIVVRVQ